MNERNRERIWDRIDLRGSTQRFRCYSTRRIRGSRSRTAKRHASTVSALIEAGADVDHISYYGETALSLTREDDIMEALRAECARRRRENAAAEDDEYVQFERERAETTSRERWRSSTSTATRYPRARTSRSAENFRARSRSTREASSPAACEKRPVPPPLD